MLAVGRRGYLSAVVDGDDKVSMTSRQRLLMALNRGIPDRLPVTTHHVMPWFLNKTLDGMGAQAFFDRFGFDPIDWVVAHVPDTSQGDYVDPEQGEPGFLEPPVISSDRWRIERETIPDSQYRTTRFRFVTPRQTLSMVLQADEQTAWVAESMFKAKSDLDIFAEYAPMPLCDVSEVNLRADAFGERGIIRGAIPGFDIYGQPGCWQDLTVQFGIENLIMETFTDPTWVHAALKVFLERKKKFLLSTKGANYDLLELGGGSASSTVISPSIIEVFVAPYDTELIELAHQIGQRVVYHTCGGMMPILEMLARMKPDAMETFTPRNMGGDVDLKEAKKRISDFVCMIGGFDQFHFLKSCSPAETRREVRRCFEAAGEGGGYILAPSDHFFEADIACLDAFADEARRCVYP